MRYFKLGLIVGVLIAVTLYAAFSYGNRYLESWASQVVLLQEPTTFEFKRGTSLQSLSDELYRQKLISHPKIFEFWVKRFDKYSKYQAGTYRFEGSASPAQISSKFRQGDIYEPVVLKFTIPEGFTLKKIIERLAKHKVCSVEECTRLTTDKKLIEELKLEAPNLEGFLYPATYRFTKKPSARKVFAKMVKTFWKRLPPDYLDAIAEKGLSLSEAVTMASLIELETSRDDERALVAEVIWNRLNKKIALAIDASIIYGIADYDGDLTWKHLKDKKNPYNTRVHRGLPPGPIGSPSVKSLAAILNPSSFGYMYYVLDVDSDGKHHFSKTLREHNKYVQKLVRKKRKEK